MSETVGKRAGPVIKKWKILLIILAVAIPILVASLVVYATNIKVEAWWITKQYEAGAFFTVNLKFAIGNPSAFAVTVQDVSFRLMVDGVDMGFFGFQEEWYTIPAFDWRVFTGTFNITGEDADYLGSVDTYYVYVIMRGKANCMFYSALFETTYTMDNVSM